MSSGPARILAAATEAALNGYLGMDPEIAARLDNLEGKVLALEILGLGAELYVLPNAGRVQVVDSYDGEPDVTLRGSPFAFAQLAQGGVLGTGIEIRGDTALGQYFQTVLRDVEIDWEETLSGFTGDVVAHQIGNIVRDFTRWGSQVSETLIQNTSEYLQEERRDLPPEVTVNAFLDEVDTLQADVERLEARIDRLLALQDRDDHSQ